MTVLRRFFIENIPLVLKAQIRIDGQQHTHLKKSLRLKEGQQIEIFDGNGVSVLATIDTIGKNYSDLHISSIGSIGNGGDISSDTSESLVNYDPRIDIASSLPKSSRADWMVEKLSEISVRSLYLVETDNSKSTGSHGNLTDNKIERFQRITIEAAKQSKNNQVMKIFPMESLQSFINNRIIKENLWSHIIVGHPTGQPLPQLIDKLKIDYQNQQQQQQQHLSSNSLLYKSPRLLIMTGSEGGFTENEIQKLSKLSNIYPTSFSNSILRMETFSMLSAGIFTQYYSYMFPPPTLPPKS